MGCDHDEPRVSAYDATIDDVRARVLTMDFKSIGGKNTDKSREFHAATAMGKDAAETPLSIPARCRRDDATTLNAQTSITERGAIRVRRSARCNSSFSSPTTSR